MKKQVTFFMFMMLLIVFLFGKANAQQVSYPSADKFGAGQLKPSFK